MFFLFFFFKQKTAYEIYQCDWSSDVCSSDLLPGGNPGDLIRMEPLDAAIPAGAQGFRILYLSQRGDGTPVAASGMVFVPTGQVPEGGRPVVAWAHPTVGMGDQCAPSRAADPLASMSWLEDMLDQIGRASCRERV